jgi:autotransporter passenger strand-loop-strand repeat protein/T5SS/PEP-CTERM-associated repeat protein
MTFYTVSSGATSSGIILRKGDFLYVSSGGTAEDITVSSGATEFVFSGGTSSDTAVHAGGAEFVYSSGAAIDTTLSTGGYLIALSGSDLSGTIRSGGSTVSTGVALVTLTSGTTVYSGAVSGVVLGDGAIEFVLSGGATSNTTVDSGGFEAVGIGGTAVGTVVSDGGYEALSGGTSSDSTVHSGGFMAVSAGGATINTVVDSGGTEHVYDGGVASDTTLSSGGTEYVFPAGLTVSTAVDRGGTEVVYGGGTSISTTVSSGGTEIVDPSGIESGTVVSSGGHLVEPARAGSGGLVIDVDYDASVAKAPAAFETTVNAAVAYLESQFSTPITITIDVGYGEVDGTKLTNSDLGESTDEGIYVSYSDLRSALLSRTATSDEIAAAAGLPATDPAGSDAEYFLSYAEAEALGLSSGPGAGVAVGDIGLSSTSPFTYGTTNGAGANTFDAFGIVEHEMTEVLGRADDLGEDGAGIYTPLDLFRYTSAGVRDLTPTAGYFSVNGSTLLYQFNNPSNGGDAGDWSTKVPDDSFDAFASEGVANPVSPTDLRVMDAIGYTPASAGSTIAAWSNLVSADWSTALDWSDGVVPNSTMIGVLLSQLGTYTVSVGAGESFAVDAVTMSGSGGTLLVNGTITVTGTSLPDGNLVVGKNQGDDATLVIGSTGRVVGAGTSALEIGSGLDANGTVMVNGGSLGGIDGIDVGEVGLGQLLLNGGLVNAGTGDIDVGIQSGDFGLLAVNGGGMMAGGTLAVGSAASSGFVEIGFTGAGTVIAAAVTVGAEGSITLGSPAALLSTSGALIVGAQGSGASLTDFGSVNVTGAANVGVGPIAAATGIVTVSLGTLSYAGGLVVGGGASGSSGTLVAYAGSLLSGSGATNSTLGQSAGSDGVVSVIGAIWNANGPLVVGASGVGALTISEGTPQGLLGTDQGVVNAGTNSITIGAALGATGSVRVELGGTLEAGALLVGVGGSGSLDVSFEGQVNLVGTGNVNVGAAPGGSGAVEIDGGAEFDANGYFSVGAANASGALLVESGGTLTTGGTSALGDIDASGSGTAAAAVSGAWIVDGPILVGNTGAGTLVVQGGGLVDAADLYGGVQSSGDGDIVVTGTASALTLTGQLIVGDASSAVLSISSAATVAAASGYLGLGTGGAGVINLAGAGSALDITNSLSIGGSGTGTLTMGANTTLAIASRLGIGSRGVLQQSGGVLDAVNLTNAGSVTGGGGAEVSVGSTLLNDGVWAATLGDDTLDVGAPGGGGLAGGTIDGTGSLVIGDGGDLIVSAGTVFASQSVAFTNSGTTGVLTIGTLAGFAAVIDSFNTQAEILVAGTSIVGDAFVANTLTLFGGGGFELGTLAFGADAVSGGYLTTSDGGIVEVQCFVAGTRIRTDRGEVAVEAIGVGDKVCVLLGDGPAGDGVAPVIWVGRREVDCARHPAPGRVWPVRVAAGAFGPGQPHSALFLSPDHAVYIQDVLIPVRYLVNGSTIVQVPRQRVVYHHLELAEHDVLLAQGLPAESFLDMRDGSKYPDRPGPVRLYPDASARMWEAFGCARLVVSGPELAAARALVNGIARAARRVAGTDELAVGYRLGFDTDGRRYSALGRDPPCQLLSLTGV